MSSASPPRWLSSAAVALLAGLLVLATQGMLVAGRQAGESAPVSPETSQPTVGSPSSPTTTQSPEARPATDSASPSASESASDAETGAPSRLPLVSEASPRRLELIVDGSVVADIGFDSATEQAATPLMARSRDEVTRLEARGLPGSPGSDSVVILGEDRFDDAAALNRLPDVQAGDQVRLTTDEGVLTYEVAHAREVSADQVLDAPEVVDVEPGRLTVVGVRYEADGTRGDHDLVVVATLVDADRS